MELSLAFGLRTLFVVLGCLVSAFYFYIGTFPPIPVEEIFTPWMISAVVDIYIIILGVAAWIVYKEANWISSVIWLLFLIIFGSPITCLYIVVQLIKLSPIESLQDPIHFALRRKKEEESRSLQSVASARVLYIVLGCLMVGSLISALIIGGSPFRRQIWTVFLQAVVLDIYAHVVILGVWIAYKESNWKITLFWITSLLLFRSISLCAYIVLQLFNLPSQDPSIFVIFRRGIRQVLHEYEESLQVEENCTSDN